MLAKESAQGSTAIKWQSQDLNPGQLTPAFTPVLSTKLYAKSELDIETVKPNNRA